jgi:hypothetical protein
MSFVIESHLPRTSMIYISIFIKVEIQVEDILRTELINIWWEGTFQWLLGSMRS